MTTIMDWENMQHQPPFCFCAACRCEIYEGERYYRVGVQNFCASCCTELTAERGEDDEERF